MRDGIARVPAGCHEAFELFQHGVHMGREPVELIAGPLHRRAHGKVTGDDGLCGAGQLFSAAGRIT